MPNQDFSISVIIPARNEAGNIENIVRKMPRFGKAVEIIFVEGGSTDGTLEKIREVVTKYPDKNIRWILQEGKGKGDAVRKGFDAATGDVLMILDADLSVEPEELPNFYEALRNNRGRFVNGTRLIYPIEKGAMQFLNKLANIFFAYALSWILRQKLTDTLCGTKVLSRSDYRKIKENRKFFGDFDPFGDFDLLFGASRLGLKIAEVPVNYKARKYGKTNIRRFKEGWQLLKMTLLGIRKFKFKWIVHRLIKKEYIIIFCLALFLRVLLALILFYSFGEEGFITKDARGQYLPLAENFALGKGFTLDGVTAYAYKAPGYPLFLAFFYKIFGVFWPAIIVQIILSSFLAVLIFKISELIGLDKKIPWIAAILTATAPHLIYYGNLYVTESLFAFLLLLGILFFLKFLKQPTLKYAFLAGFLFGLDTLVKVSTQYLVILCLLFVILFILYSHPEIRGKFILFSAIFFLVFIAVIAPLAFRNYKYFGTFNLNSQSAYLLYRYEGSSIISVRDKISLGEAEKVARKELLFGTGLENVAEEKLVDLKYAPILKKKTFDLMKSNIGAVIKIELINVLAFWTHSNYAYLLSSSYKIIPSPPPLEQPFTYLLAKGEWGKILTVSKSVFFSPYYLIALFSRIFWVLVALLAIFGLIYSLLNRNLDRNKRILILLLGFTILYYNLTAAPLGFGMEARLRYHTEPLMFLMASFGFLILYNSIKNCYTSRRLKMKFENQI